MSTPVLKEVTRIHDSLLTDVPARLRKIAAAIEAGEHGEVLTAVLCILHTDDEVGRASATFSMGPLSDVAMCAALLTNEARELVEITLCSAQAPAKPKPVSAV